MLSVFVALCLLCFIKNLCHFRNKIKGKCCKNETKQRDHPFSAIKLFVGGAWPNGGRQLRSANRSWKGPTHRSTNGKGFRVAMTL